MTKTFYFVVVFALAVLSSCREKDQRFCDCLKAGEELNVFSSKMMTGEVTKEQDAKLQQLMRKKAQVCEPYQTMKGPELLENKEGCK
jgi:hypothetical protein